MTVRLLLWSLADAQTTLEELRERLPPLRPPSLWISDAAGDRFGVIAFEDVSDGLAEVRALIGKDPELGEEFDVEEPA